MPVDHAPLVTAPAFVLDIIREAIERIERFPMPLNGYHSKRNSAMTAINYRTANVDGFKIFYREAGAPDAPKLLLLHGFPSASHMFRDLIPLLADRFHIVAPDLPGFGNSDMPGRGHSFDRIADTIDRFTEIVGFDRYAVYVFDYGAPTGFRLASSIRTGSPRSSRRMAMPMRKD